MMKHGCVVKDMSLERSFFAKTMTISSLVHPSKSNTLLLGKLSHGI
jgi:hypothetical protein